MGGGSGIAYLAYLILGSFAFYACIVLYMGHKEGQEVKKIAEEEAAQKAAKE